MMIGLAGAHRTGKTTLARRFSEVSGYSFLETKVSAVFEQHGLSPREHYPTETRLWIQRKTLDKMVEVYSSHRSFAVVDRTPIDLAAYMLADITRAEIAPEIDQQVIKYVDDCIAVAREFFSAIVIVQPGIKIVDEPGKAPPIESYIEHLNAICLGLINSNNIGPASAYSISRSCTELDERCEALISIAANLPMPSNVIPYQQKTPM
jgi:hypothetical protein